MGKGKGGKRWRKRMKWRCTALVLIRAEVAAHQFILIHGVIARSDLLFLLFNYLLIIYFYFQPARAAIPVSSEHHVWCRNTVRAWILLSMFSWTVWGAWVSPNKEMKALKRGKSTSSCRSGYQAYLSVTQRSCAAFPAPHFTSQFSSDRLKNLIVQLS